MCKYCEKRKEIKSINFCGRAKARIVGADINIFGDSKKIRLFKNIYAPRFKINFCPMCGRNLNEETEKLAVVKPEFDGKFTDSDGENAEYSEYMVHCAYCDFPICYSTECNANANFKYCNRCGKRVIWKDDNLSEE